MVPGLKSAEKTEEFLVSHGFARISTQNEIERDGQKVRWLDGQKRYGLNMDEMSFGLSGDANSKGGRPGAFHIASMIKNSGQAS